MGRQVGTRQLVVALVAAVVSFMAAGAGLFYRVADVAKLGWRFGGPVALTGEMAGLFGGGLAGVVVLIAVLWWSGRRDG